MAPPKRAAYPPRPPALQRCAGARASPRRWLGPGRRPPILVADKDRCAARDAGCFRRHDEAVHRIQALWDAAGVPPWHRALYAEHLFADDVPAELLLQEADALAQNIAPVQVASRAVEAREEVLDALVQLRLRFDDSDFFEELGLARRSLAEQLVALRRATIGAVEALVTWRRTFTSLRPKEKSSRCPSDTCSGVSLHKKPCWPHGKAGEDYLRTIASNDTVVRTFGFVLDLPSFCDPFVARPEESEPTPAIVGVNYALRLPILRKDEIERIESLRFLLRDELHVFASSKTLASVVVPRRAHCAGRSADVDHNRAYMSTPSRIHPAKPELPPALPPRPVSTPRRPRSDTCRMRHREEAIVVTRIDDEKAKEIREIVVCSSRASEASCSGLSSENPENVGPSVEVSIPAASSSTKRPWACDPASAASQPASSSQRQSAHASGPTANQAETSSAAQRASFASVHASTFPECNSKKRQSTLILAPMAEETASASAKRKSTISVPGSTSPKRQSSCSSERASSSGVRADSKERADGFDVAPGIRGPRASVAATRRASFRKSKTVQPPRGSMIPLATPKLRRASTRAPEDDEKNDLFAKASESSKELSLQDDVQECKFEIKDNKRREKYVSVFERLMDNDQTIHRDDIQRALEFAGIGNPSPEVMDTAYTSTTQYTTMSINEFLTFAGKYEALERLVWQETFAKFDEDASGSMERAEMKDFLKHLGIEPMSHVVEELLYEVDHSGNGKVELEEFYTLMGLLNLREGFTSDEYSRILDLFKMFDRKGDNEIDVDDVPAMLRYMGYSSTVVIIDDLISDIDVDETGFLDQSEWVLLMRKIRDQEVQWLKNKQATNDSCCVTELLRSSGYLVNKELVNELVASVGGPEEAGVFDVGRLWQLMTLYRQHEGLCMSYLEDTARAFAAYQNPGGELEAAALGCALRSIGYVLTFEQLQALKSEVDVENSANFSLGAFRKLLRMFREQEAQAARKIFQDYTGVQGPGAIDAEAAQEALDLIECVNHDGNVPEVDLEYLDEDEFLDFVMKTAAQRRVELRRNMGFSGPDLLQLRLWFSEFDADLDGTIARGEATHLIERMCPQIAKDARLRPKLQAILKEVIDTKQRMEYEDFVRLMRKCHDEQERANLEKERKAIQASKFTSYDVKEYRDIFLHHTGGDGETLDFEVLKSLLVTLCPVGEKNEAELAKIVRDVKFEGNPDFLDLHGRVDFPEFLKVMQTLEEKNFGNINDVAAAFANDRTSTRQQRRRLRRGGGCRKERRGALKGTWLMSNASEILQNSDIQAMLAEERSPRPERRARFESGEGSGSFRSTNTGCDAVSLVSGAARRTVGD